MLTLHTYTHTYIHVDCGAGIHGMQIFTRTCLAFQNLSKKCVSLNLISRYFKYIYLLLAKEKYFLLLLLLTFIIWWFSAWTRYLYMHLCKQTSIFLKKKVLEVAVQSLKKKNKIKR